MAPESDDNLRLEIGHVLFIDIVGYSKLLIEEQKERLGELTSIVLATAQVRESTDEQLVRLPTGDGRALVFRRSAEEPARCALEIAITPQSGSRRTKAGRLARIEGLTSRLSVAVISIQLDRFSPQRRNAWVKASEWALSAMFALDRKARSQL
jgi:hypothetical protein